MRQAGPEKRQEILEWLPHINRRLAQLRKTHNSAQSTIQSLTASHDAVQGQINQAARDAIQMVRFQEHKLKEKVGTNYGALIHRQRQRENAAAADIDALTSLKETLEYVVAEDDVELLHQTLSLTPRYTEVIRSVGGESEEGEAVGQVTDTQTFAAASLSDLKSVVLVGFLQSGKVQVSSRYADSNVIESTAEGLRWVLGSKRWNDRCLFVFRKRRF